MIDLRSIYSKHAERFDVVRQSSSVERPYLERALHVAGEARSILDLGCGTAEPIAGFFIRRGHRVTGVDFSEAMLTICRRRFPDMDWLAADMRDLQLGATFDIVLAWESFFHLPPDDQRGMFPVFRAHVRPGGALVFTSGLEEESAVGGSLFGDPLYHASLSTSEYERRLEQSGFSVALHVIEDPECGGRTIWIARREGESGLLGRDDPATLDTSSPCVACSSRRIASARPPIPKQISRGRFMVSRGPPRWLDVSARAAPGRARRRPCRRREGRRSRPGPDRFATTRTRLSRPSRSAA